MNNLLVHRSHPRPEKNLSTISAAIIDKEQTPLCSPWRWRISKLRIPPPVRSLYFRLRGRTPVTLLKPSDNARDVNYGQRSPTRSYNIEPLQPSISNHTSPVASNSSMGGNQDVSIPSQLSLPGAVGESEVFATTRSASLQSMSASNRPTSHDKSAMSGKTEAKKTLFHKPKYIQSNSDHLIYQRQTGKGLDNDKTYHDAASDANLKDSQIDSKSTQNADNERAIIQGESVDASSKEKVKQTVDTLVITHSTSPSASSYTDSDVEISNQDKEPTAPGDEVSSEPRPVSRIGRELGEQEPRTPSPVEGFLTEEESVGIRSSVDFSNPDATEEVIPWARSEETTTTVDYSEFEEELDYYEENDEEQNDDLDMDNVLQRCPPTEVLQNLRDMVQLSKNTTSQLEKALRRAARISCGPFPRLPGSGLTKTEVIDLKCAKLVGETEEFLGDMNKNFLTFYTVLEQMDKVSAQQDTFVSSILIQRGPRDWRRGHAAILKKMDKLWSRDYPKVITRKLKGNIQETIHEVIDEQ